MLNVTSTWRFLWAAQQTVWCNVHQCYLYLANSYLSPAVYIPLTCNVFPLDIPLKCNVCPLYIPLTSPYNVCPLFTGWISHTHTDGHSDIWTFWGDSSQIKTVANIRWQCTDPLSLIVIVNCTPGESKPSRLNVKRNKTTSANRANNCVMWFSSIVDSNSFLLGLNIVKPESKAPTQVQQSPHKKKN